MIGELEFDAMALPDWTSVDVGFQVQGIRVDWQSEFLGPGDS